MKPRSINHLRSRDSTLWERNAVVRVFLLSSSFFNRSRGDETNNGQYSSIILLFAPGRRGIIDIFVLLRNSREKPAARPANVSTGKTRGGFQPCEISIIHSFAVSFARVRDEFSRRTTAIGDVGKSHRRHWGKHVPRPVNRSRRLNSRLSNRRRS